MTEAIQKKIYIKKNDWCYGKPASVQVPFALTNGMRGFASPI